MNVDAMVEAGLRRSAVAGAAHPYGEQRACSVVGRIHLLVVGCHPVVCAGLRQFLHGSERIGIVGEAEFVRDAVRLACRLRPEVVLLDGQPPDMFAAEAVKRIRGVSPRSKIVVFAAAVTPAAVVEADQLAVAGLLGKQATGPQILHVITLVAAGEAVRDDIMLDALRRAAEKLHGPQLTVREYQIVCRAALGESNAQIAEAIHLAPNTVKSYLQNALPKLGARNRVEAVAKLCELGLL
jgi:two-component system nitrate/nitrite response regulator NarL